LEDLRAVVEEAKRWHRDVAAHAYGGAEAKLADLSRYYCLPGAAIRCATSPLSATWCS
jgi:hypothetical protein